MKLPPFQFLIDEHWPDVARLAHALAGPNDGDDVAQQAWVQALAGYPKLRTATNLRSWLLTITARCAMDAHRSRARRPVPIADLVPTGPGAQEPLAGGPQGQDPQEQLTDSDLWAAVRELPERQRTAIALRYLADLDHAQVAAALATTPAASRRLVSDALKTLRQQTGPEPTAAEERS